MAVNPNQLPIQQAPEEAGEVHLTPSLERAYEQGEINLTEARLYSGHQAVSHEVAPIETLVSPSRHLEVVTEDHVPSASAKHAAILRGKPKARTPYEKMAADADSVPEHIKVTPLGHDYVPTVIDGGESPRR